MNLSNRIAIACALLVVVALATGCNKTNESFCCLSEASCAERGADEITPCTDPDRPYCDEAGEFGPGFGCVPDPGGACDGPSDCDDPEFPFCVNDTCVECEESVDCAADAPVCGAANQCEGCTAEADCEGRAETPRCLESSGTCVQCEEAGDCASATAPVCDEDTNACRGCATDGECPSEVCDEGAGTCAAEADVIYVATGGTDTGTCTSAAPCATITFALGRVTGTRDTIKVRPGTYAGQVLLDDITVAIVGDQAIIEPAALNQSAVVVTNGADVVLDGLTVRGAGGASNPAGALCQTAGATPNITLTRMTVMSNAGAGFSSSACAVAVRNSFFVKNGGPSSDAGGVRIASPTSLEFEFNTVADNVTAGGFAAGIQCTSVAARTISNSIVVGSGADQTSSTNCSFTYTLSNEATAGTGNVTGSATFVNAAENDYHLAAGSSGIDVADLAATLDRDFDGDARPQNGRSDMGADEVVP